MKKVISIKKGIDISYYQGSIDFDKVKNSGIEFVILREGYREETDAKFYEYVEECKKVDLPIKGVYHFSYALNEAEAKKEALKCISNVKEAGLGEDVVIFFDFEYDTVEKAKKHGVTLSKAECISHTKAFCETVRSLGHTPGVYSNIDYYKNWYDKELLDSYIFWLADYMGKPDYSCEYHQYTNNGTVPGINGEVDLDYYYGEETDDETSTKCNVSTIIDIMESWVGLSQSAGTHKVIIDIYNSYEPLANGYKVKYSDAYCDTTVSAAFIKANAVNLIGGTECGVERHIQLFKNKGIWIEDGTITPKVGDICCYNWDDSTQPNDGFADHIGIVKSVDESSGSFIVIEGNMNDDGVVGYNTVSVGWGYIRGFARPNYENQCDTVESETDKTITSDATYDVDEIAKKVIAGEYGNGDERKKKIELLGLSYEEVQERVNEFLGAKHSTSTRTVSYATHFSNGIAGTYKVAADILNCRYNPGELTDDNIVAKFQNGTKVQNYGYYTPISGVDWYLVRYNDKVGYVSSDYIIKV